MGDILGGVFGGGQQTEESQEADPVSQAMNELRYQQLANLFGGTGLAQFGKPRENLYSLDKETRQIRRDILDDADIMSLQDYMNLGIGKGKSYISQVAKPEIMSTMALQGLEGGGAVGEALGKATAGIALPFLQSIPGFMGASSAYNNNLLSVADLPRSLKQEDFLRRQGVVTTGLTGLPYTPTIDKSGGTSSLPLFNMFGMGGSL